MMIKILYFTPDDVVHFSDQADEIRWLIDSEYFFWLDIYEEPNDGIEKIMSNDFHFHPLAIDDALKEIHVPKIDDWGDYLYLVFHSVVLNNIDEADVNTLELDVFINKRFLVTYQEQYIPNVDQIFRLCRDDKRFLKRGSAYILYKIIDQFSECAMYTYGNIEDEIESIEDDIFASPNQSVLERLFTVKRILLYLRRIITPQRNVLGLLARMDYEALDEQYKMFFRDVYDHYVRLSDMNDSMRELVSEALNSYLSIVNNRLNDVMKVLTIITTFFMPISFISGFFGMNFFQPVVNLDGWTGYVAFWLTLIIMLILPLSMYFYIKKKHWL